MLKLLRSPRLRVIGLLVQVVALCCQLVEGTGREHCPHHDMGAAPPDMAMVMAMGGMHANHPADGQAHSCRCLGDCHSSAAVLPTAPMAALPDSPARRTESTVTLLVVAPARQFRLPPALGPPLSA